MRYVLFAAVFVFLAGCDFQNEAKALSSMKDMNKVWVFAQFNVAEEADGVETYYYYAQISEKLYNAIAYNEINSGFILLEKVKYWGDQDLIYDYKDAENSGDLVFRIEDVAKIKLVNGEPVSGRGYEQFEEPSKEEAQNTESTDSE